MPELPEVETVRRVLAKRLLGRVLERLEIPAKSFYRKQDPDALRAVSEGRRLTAIERLGKFMFFQFEGGGELVVHLGMTGYFGFEPPTPHARMVFHFAGATAVFEDPRRFGFVRLNRPRLGPEPLSAAFKPADFARLFKGKKATIHAALLDQQTIAGVGNIYATEALAAAGIRPSRRAGTLTADEARRLYTTVRRKLEQGIACGGATLDDGGYLDPDGNNGTMQMRLQVYGRDTCRRCKTAVSMARKRLSGRTARFCPRCQS